MSQIQWFPGHMAKGQRLIYQYKKIVNLYIIVVDARAPHSSLHNSFTRYNIEPKNIILVFSKIDLVDKKELDKWIYHYKNIFFDVLDLNLLNNNEVNTKLFKLISNYFSFKKIPNKYIMILGSPNVGKSTLINSLNMKKKIKVENRPGVTKGVTWISYKDLFIFDTPGILEPKIDENRIAYNLIFTNSIKWEILQDHYDIIDYLFTFLKNRYPNIFLEYYKLNSEDILKPNHLIIEDLIIKKNMYLKNKEQDYERLYKSIFIEVSKGKIGKLIFDFYEKK